LWATGAERGAMRRVLSACPTMPLPPRGVSPVYSSAGGKPPGTSKSSPVCEATASARVRVVADARTVLELAVREAALLANSGGHPEQLQDLANLARDALDAGDGELDDDRVREGGLSPGDLEQLGL